MSGEFAGQQNVHVVGWHDLCAMVRFSPTNILSNHKNLRDRVMPSDQAIKTRNSSNQLFAAHVLAASHNTHAGITRVGDGR